MLAEAGPLKPEGEVSDPPRGELNFRAMVTRIDVVRVATVRNELGALPITTGPPADGPVGYKIPENEGCIRRRAPAVSGCQPLFAVRLVVGRGRLSRYPRSGERTDECPQRLRPGSSSEGSAKYKDAHLRLPK